MSYGIITYKPKSSVFSKAGLRCNKESCQEIVKFIFIEPLMRRSTLAVLFLIGLVTQYRMTRFALEELHPKYRSDHLGNNFEYVAKDDNKLAGSRGRKVQFRVNGLINSE